MRRFRDRRTHDATTAVVMNRGVLMERLAEAACGGRAPPPPANQPGQEGGGTWTGFDEKAVTHHLEDRLLPADARPKMSGRNSWREIPVNRSSSSTRSAGARPRARQLATTLGLRMASACVAFVSPPSAEMAFSIAETASFIPSIITLREFYASDQTLIFFTSRICD